MTDFRKFLAVGMVFAAVEEFLTVALLKDFGSFVATVVVVFPVFLTFVYFRFFWEFSGLIG